MDFSEKDYAGMMFPVHKLSDKADIIKTFPQLKNYPEFNQKIEGLNSTQVFKYVVFAYDRNSPLVKDVNISISRRKAEAVKLAGFVLADEKYDDDVFGMITCRTEAVAKMVVRYCRMSHNMVFEDLMSRMDAHYNENLWLKTEPDATKRKSCLQNLSLLKTEIEALTNELLSADNNTFLKEELYAEIELGQLGITVEEMADKRDKGVDPLGGYTPYE